MLNVKKLLSKMLRRIGKFSATTSINLNSNWTAPSDGIVNARVGWNIADYGYMYIKDYTTNDFVCCISDAGALGGFSASSSFPVIKGHTYKVDMQNQVGLLNATFYAL